MKEETLNQRQRIEIPLLEYNLLREAYRQFKKQALLFRIIEAEENLKRKGVKKISIDKFIEKII
jgi:hypothetical protein